MIIFYEYFFIKKTCLIFDQNDIKTRRYNTEERERQITFKCDLEAAERELSTALQTNIQLQEAYDELKSEKEKATHKATRTITKTESELSRLKKVYEYEKARRIEMWETPFE